MIPMSKRKQDVSMDIKWHDVTIPMKPEMTVWPGDPPFCFEAKSRMAAGDSCNTSTLSMSTHTGTHCDAPWHFIDDGKRLGGVDTDLFFGEAILIEIRGASHIRADHLPEAPLPPRVLFKTDNAGYPPDTPFRDEFTAIEEDAAARIVSDSVRLVGVDYLSVAPRGRSAGTHRILLENNVFVIEGLLLAGFPAGRYPFIVLPLAIENADGAPCRAFLGTIA
jgi:arylformamidase